MRRGSTFGSWVFRALGLAVPAVGALAACGGLSRPDGAPDAAAPQRDASGVAEASANVNADGGFTPSPDGGVDASPGEDATPPQDGGIDAPSEIEAGASAPCSLGSVQFLMRAGSLDAGYEYVTSFGIPGDGRWWYSVSAPDGGALDIFPSVTSCAACGPEAIPIGYECGGLGDAGASATWDGTAVTGSSSCENAPGGIVPPGMIPCQTIVCQPAGRYAVTMCAFTQPGCASSASPPEGNVCVTVPFDYPTSSVVAGTLP